MENLPAGQDQDEIIIKCSLEEMTKAFFKDYEIIWHDPNVNSEENQQYMTQLETLCKVKTFLKWKDADDYIKTAKTICHVLTSGTNGELLVKEIFSNQNVPSIFTFCRNEEYHSTWTQNYEKVLCSATKIEDVLSQIQNNLLGWHKQTSSLKFDLPAFAPVFDESDKSQMNYLHLYLKVIPSFHNRQQAKMDIVNLSKAVYSEKKNGKLIADFEQTYGEYNKEAILKWYTQQSFLYKVVNNCLRIATSDSIQWSRFLLKDIETAIKDQYQTKSKSFSGLLYRAAYLSEKEWSSLKENVNREIEMHGFLSVSKEKSIALKFMGLDANQKVFITIIVPKGPTEDEQGFAEIEEFSRFPKEKEVLFNVRSRFTLLEAEENYSKELPYRHLVLFYGAQGLRKFLTEENPKQKVSIENVENLLCSHCKISAGEMTEKLLFLSLGDLEKRIYYCKKCLDDNDTVAPFLCVPVTEKAFSTEIKGCLLLNSSQTQFPFYGYKCLKCGINKNQKRYFVCTDCDRKWCQNCFGNTLSCIEMKHAIILETSPFSFWCEKMSKNELNHWRYQNDVVLKSNHEFQQAQMYLKSHEYAKAVEYYLKFIDIHGEHHPDISYCFNNLAFIYEQQGEYSKAREYYLKSLDLFKSIHGENHLSAATSYANLGNVYSHQGEYNKALDFHLKSLDIRQSVHGENHPDVAASHDNLGLIYEKQGEYNKALESHLKSLEIYKGTHGETHPDIANSYHSLGTIYQKQGEYEKAAEHYSKSLDIFKAFYGENHPFVATAYDSLGNVYNEKVEYNKALEYYLKSLDITKLIYGENHPSVATSYSNIGNVYCKQGEYKKTFNSRLKALGLDKFMSGNNQNDSQEDYGKALEYHLKSLDIRRLVHGETHPSVATCYSNLGNLYICQEEYDKALKFHLKSLEINKLVHGENHPEIASSFCNIGLIYESQGEYQMALEYYVMALNIYKGENSVETMALYDRIRKIAAIFQIVPQNS